jgi:hypothetical protein
MTQSDFTFLYLYPGTIHTVEDQFAHLQLWTCDYQTVAGKLVHDFGLKGEVSIRMLLGGWVWEAFTKRHRQSFLKRLRDLGVKFEISVVMKGTSVLMIGTDRVKLARGLKLQRRKKVITREQTRDMILRLGRGEFPKPADDFEVALELDLLLAE